MVNIGLFQLETLYYVLAIKLLLANIAGLIPETTEQIQCTLVDCSLLYL